MKSKIYSKFARRLHDFAEILRKMDKEKIQMDYLRNWDKRHGNLGWLFFNKNYMIRSRILKKLHVLTLHLSEYYPDCIAFYNNIDVKGKTILDMGSDFGTTPMYFIQKGALQVLGVSGMKQYFKHPSYKQIGILSFSDVMKIQDHLHFNILKSDTEGFEWEYTIPFIESFQDWIIACHTPIRNPELFEYIKSHGRFIGSQIGTEFGIYKKVTE